MSRLTSAQLSRGDSNSTRYLISSLPPLRAHRPDRHPDTNRRMEYSIGIFTDSAPLSRRGEIHRAMLVAANIFDDIHRSAVSDTSTAPGCPA